jgi:hypothetical protein
MTRWIGISIRLPAGTGVVPGAPAGNWFASATSSTGAP